MVAKAEETGTPVRPLEHSAEETLATGLPQSRLRPSTGDVIFFIVLLAALTGVALSARVAWLEASLMEHAKAQAQTLHRWAVSVASDPDSTEPVPPTICAPLSGEPGEGADADAAAPSEPTALTWGQCKAQWLDAGGLLAGAQNPFGEGLPLMRARCERGNFAGRGGLVIEKGVHSPPGFPPTVSWEPMPDSESMAKGLLIRFSACDAAGSAIHVGEAKL